MTLILLKISTALLVLINIELLVWLNIYFYNTKKKKTNKIDKSCLEGGDYYMDSIIRNKK
jgi:hypothetical protein